MPADADAAGLPAERPLSQLTKTILERALGPSSMTIWVSQRRSGRGRVKDVRVAYRPQAAASADRVYEMMPSPPAGGLATGEIGAHSEKTAGSPCIGSCAGDSLPNAHVR